MLAALSRLSANRTTHVWESLLRTSNNTTHLTKLAKKKHLRRLNMCRRTGATTKLEVDKVIGDGLKARLDSIWP